MLDTVCSLHAAPNVSPFFVSDVVYLSLNPVFPVQISCERVDPSASPQERISVCHHYRMTVRIWRVCSDKQPSQLLLEWDVDLRGIQFIGRKLNHLDKDLARGTLLFQFKNGYYTAADIAETIKLPPKPNEPITLYDTYNFRQVIRLVEMHRKVIGLYAGTRKLAQQIMERMKQNDRLFAMKRSKGEQENEIRSLIDRLLTYNMQIEAEKTMLDNLQERTNVKRAIVKEHSKRLHDAVVATEALEQELCTTRQLLYSMKEHVKVVQQERLTTLCELYPIDHAVTIDTIYTIRGIRLPNSEYKGYALDDVATALGYTCHLVEMIAFYLRVPLIYPMVAMSSRAYIIDPSAIDADQAIYPLYGKGQDAARWRFGVFLLNMNVQQLMLSQNINAKRPRDTLPNILTLLWKICDND
ncbi:UV radiation resistance protein and autophagy-related subunit 14-domain-containing protein [Syncephalis fuscata]|nr:UV radiation resistance protein and autophagy-related subunit 14-domain-containing protein [Syncephalis fuscata]